MNLIKQHIIDMFEMDATVNEVVEFLDKHLLVCIVTQDEDKKLNQYGYKTELGIKLNTATVWNRYKCSFITVCEVYAEKVDRKCYIRIKNEIVVNGISISLITFPSWSFINSCFLSDCFDTPKFVPAIPFISKPLPVVQQDLVTFVVI